MPGLCHATGVGEASVNEENKARLCLIRDLIDEVRRNLGHDLVCSLGARTEFQFNWRKIRCGVCPAF